MSWTEKPAKSGGTAGREGNGYHLQDLPRPSPGRVRDDARRIEGLVAAARASIARGARRIGADLPHGMWRL